MSKQYLCIQRSTPSETNADSKPSPAQMEEMYAKFTAWKDKYQDKITDMGGKLGEGKMVTPGTITDGPFAEAKEIVGGYMIVTAENIDEAAQVALESPGVAMPGSSVEVREISTS